MAPKLDRAVRTRFGQLGKVIVIVFALSLMFSAARAQVSSESPQENVYVLEGTSEAIAYGVGKTLRINGIAKQGAVALGGDVIVQGVVAGDAAAVGGSVILLEGGRIDGDVIVVGGTYRQPDNAAQRKPHSVTIMYTGYEEQLRNMMREPSGLLKPRWSAAYIGWRLLAILFWFIVSLALSAAMPGTISRGVARLQLTSFRVALIGVLGAVTIGLGVPFSLHYLPTPIGMVVGLMALTLLLIAGVFGRVIIYAATGQWLQRKYLPLERHSESLALLLGTSFWMLLSSLPYVWPIVVAMILTLSLGLALTARYRTAWSPRTQT